MSYEMNEEESKRKEICDVFIEDLCEEMTLFGNTNNLIIADVVYIGSQFMINIIMADDDITENHIERIFEGLKRICIKKKRKSGTNY